ncbi:MAG: ABC transporter permease [Anaerolineae bacterium]|nr:ABC transporter permease [Anaerolineae bacterium]
MRSSHLDRVIDTLMPVFAVILALIIGAVLLLLLGANPIEAYRDGLYEGALGSKNAVSDTLIKATPLLLVGIGICISFRGGMINIGGEGQMIVGGLAAIAIALEFSDNDPVIIIPAALLASFLAGAIWGGLAGVLKAYFRVNEILSTIMLNQIAGLWMIYLVSNVFVDPEKKQLGAPIPETRRLSRSFDLPRIGESFDKLWQWLGLAADGDALWKPTLLHNGVIIAVILAVLVYILLWRTTIGYRIRAVGQNQRASRYAGIEVNRYMVLSLTLSGGFAGLAGGVQVLGVHHRMNAEAGALAFTGNAGFNGIVAALFGKLHPLGTIPASILFGALLVGGNKLQRVVQVPSSFITILIGLVIIFVVSSDIWTRQRAHRRVSVDAANNDTSDHDDPGQTPKQLSTSTPSPLEESA